MSYLQLVTNCLCLLSSSPPPPPLLSSPSFLPLTLSLTPPIPRLVSPLYPLFPCPPSPSFLLGGKEHLLSSQPHVSWAGSDLAHTYVDFTSVSLVPLGGSSRPVKDEKKKKKSLAEALQRAKSEGISLRGQGCRLLASQIGSPTAGTRMRGSKGIEAGGPVGEPALLLSGCLFMCKTGPGPPTSESCVT